VARDDAGEVVALKLSVAGTTPFPGGAVPFSLEVKQEVAELGAEASFALPAERLPESRERPWRMIENVLGDKLLPPYRK
jgi:hypothetical protein